MIVSQKVFLKQDDRRNFVTLPGWTKWTLFSLFFCLCSD